MRAVLGPHERFEGFSELAELVVPVAAGDGDVAISGGVFVDLFGQLPQRSNDPPVDVGQGRNPGHQREQQLIHVGEEIPGHRFPMRRQRRRQALRDLPLGSKQKFDRLARGFPPSGQIPSRFAALGEGGLDGLAEFVEGGVETAPRRLEVGARLRVPSRSGP